MKLIVIIGVEDYRKALHKIFQKTQIPVFSEIDIKGFRTINTEYDEQSLATRESQPIFSLMNFAFVDEGQADILMKEIEAFNRDEEVAKPIHAYQLSVENTLE